MNSIIVDINASEVECKIVCPMCPAVITLGKSNGQLNFSFYNYSRHFKTQHQVSNDSLNISLNVSMNGVGDGEYISAVNMDNANAISQSDEQLSTECKYIKFPLKLSLRLFF